LRRTDDARVQIHFLSRRSWLVAVALAAAVAAQSQTYEVKPPGAEFERFKPLLAPPVSKTPLLKQGDRLAICGDSITEQKMYSRIIETYLTVCVPELAVTVRQYGWSGERASGFLRRMTNDCLRFQPTIATTCYGMNDHRYVPWTEEIGNDYRANSLGVIRAFKAAGVRVIHGSPGPVTKMPGWVKTATGTVEDLNLSLCELRNDGIRMAAEEHVAFADVFWPMHTANHFARRQYGPDYTIAGKDGVHPGWAGQLVMAYAFLKAMGLDGDLGTLTVDLSRGRAGATKDHEVTSTSKEEFTFRSSRYPFCATGDVNSDQSIRSGMALVPFNQELNRLTLLVKGAKAGRYQVTWGAISRSYTKDELTKGVNLAADFAENPFSAAFKKVDDAVLAKQSYETKQIKTEFRGAEAKKDMDAVVARTEAGRKPLAEAVARALAPVTHTLRITAE
jgi:lysophospholipase L1-like esterase